MSAYQPGIPDPCLAVEPLKVQRVDGSRQHASNTKVGRWLRGVIAFRPRWDRA